VATVQPCRSTSLGTLAALAQLTDRGRRCHGISYKVLTEMLRRAERDGLISRHLGPGRAETATLYEVTDLGRSLDAPLAAMAEWVEWN
jgi:DNA-binding HxlR family transcriptional regulator